MNGFVFQPGVRFLDPEKILFQSGLIPGQLVADLGAGSGFFAVSAANIVGPNGLVYVVDIMEQALNHVAAEARLKNLKNIRTIRANLEEKNACKDIPEGAVDLVILANVLHQINDKAKLFGDTYRLLKTGGKALVIEWNQNPSPIGPRQDERLPEQQIIDSAKKAALTHSARIEGDNYHYCLLFTK